MATCALLGEAVGKAAAVAVKNDFTPHDVFLQKMEDVQTLLLNEDCFLPSKTRKISEICKNAALSGANDMIRNGQDRPHEIYNTDESNFACPVPMNEKVCYSFNKTNISSVHIVFSSDLNRNTLPFSDSERYHPMRANYRLDSPQMCMPKTLCKEFKLIGEQNGQSFELLNVSNNRKRSYHLNLNQSFDKLILIPISNWGDSDLIPIVSFDFN